MLTWVYIVIEVMAAVGLIFLILMHSGKGGGLSDMFGGSVGSAAAGLDGRRAQPRPDHRHRRPGLRLRHPHPGPPAAVTRPGRRPALRRRVVGRRVVWLPLLGLGDRRGRLRRAQPGRDDDHDDVRPLGHRHRRGDDARHRPGADRLQPELGARQHLGGPSRARSRPPERVRRQPVRQLRLRLRGHHAGRAARARARSGSSTRSTPRPSGPTVSRSPPPTSSTPGSSSVAAPTTTASPAAGPPASSATATSNRSRAATTAAP